MAPRMLCVLAAVSSARANAIGSDVTLCWYRVTNFASPVSEECQNARIYFITPASSKP
jgi:hypothetical protein